MIEGKKETVEKKVLRRKRISSKSDASFPKRNIRGKGLYVRRKKFVGKKYNHFPKQGIKCMIEGKKETVEKKIFT